MQIAGTKCAACGEKVGSIIDAEGCASCELAFHDACVESDECPECGASFEAQAEEAQTRRRNDAREAEDRYQRGATQLMAAAFLAVIAVGFSATVNVIYTRHEHAATFHFILLLLFFVLRFRGGLLSALVGRGRAEHISGGADAHARDLARMNGIKSQRVILAFLTTCGALFAATMAFVLRDEGAIALFGNSAVALLHGAAAGLLIFSRSVATVVSEGDA